MSKNYYVLTKDKSLISKYGLQYSLTDEPDWGYWIHICQTTQLLKPLYQAHQQIRDIDAVIRFIQEPNIQIYDEYLEPVEVQGFIDTVINDDYYVNHALTRWDDFSKSSYFSNTYFKDYKGYEFCISDFK